MVFLRTRVLQDGNRLESQLTSYSSTQCLRIDSSKPDYMHQERKLHGCNRTQCGIFRQSHMLEMHGNILGLNTLRFLAVLLFCCHFFLLLLHIPIIPLVWEKSSSNFGQPHDHHWFFGWGGRTMALVHVCFRWFHFHHGKFHLSPSVMCMLNANWPISLF